MSKPHYVPEFDVSAVGHEIQLVGGIWAGNGRAHLCIFPEFAEEAEQYELGVLVMDDEKWKALLKQSDLVETAVLSKTEDGTLFKAVVRKCQRNVDQQITWNVYRRDRFRCRYCGTDTAPLTVDHLVLWEEGGPTTEANLVASCRKCNKTRGRLAYEKWLRHPYYMRVGKALSQDEWTANEALVATLAAIPRVINIRSR